MKVLVLTFHDEKNYGAALQAFALNKKLKELYNTVKILDYRLDKTHTLKSIIIKILTFKNYIKKQKNFNTFYKNHFCLTKKVKSIEQIKEVCKEFDGIYCGSDQVWSFDIIENNKDVYFLNFDLPDNFKKNSYAASIGKENLSLDEKDNLKTLLSNFNNISVREDSAKKILNDLGYDNVKTSLDPTLLMSREEYVETLELKKNNDRYILVYMLEISEKVIEIAKKIQEKLNIKIICFNNKNYFGDMCLCMPHCGPKEFAELFYNAEYVITNSFHGTCFSIIFEKQFVSIRTYNKKYKTNIAFK